MTPEKIVQNSIVSYLNNLQRQNLPVYVERRQAGGFSYTMGIADLYAVIDGQHIEIEVKAPGKELRPMQTKWKRKCEALNITCVCADNVEIVKTLVSDILRNKK